MSILIDSNTKLITQGITGRAGLFHSQRCRDYGTNVVGGVNPKKGGEEIDGFPVFSSVKDAKEKTNANATMIFVPAAFAASAIIEAIDAEMRAFIAEFVPILQYEYFPEPVGS